MKKLLSTLLCLVFLVGVFPTVAEVTKEMPEDQLQAFTNFLKSLEANGLPITNNEYEYKDMAGSGIEFFTMYPVEGLEVRAVIQNGALSFHEAMLDQGVEAATEHGHMILGLFTWAMTGIPVEDAERITASLIDALLPDDKLDQNHATEENGFSFQLAYSSIGAGSYRFTIKHPAK